MAETRGEKIPDVRSAEPFDLPSVAEIDQISDSPAWSADAFRESIASQGTFLRVAVVHHNIVGFCCFRIVDSEMDIFKIAVSPQYRRRGIGRRLLLDAIGSLGAGGEKTIFLEVRARNRAAIALYESQGFTRSGVRKKYYSNPVDDARTMILVTSEQP